MIKKIATITNESNDVTYQSIDDAENDTQTFGPFDNIDELFKELNK